MRVPERGRGRQAWLGFPNEVDLPEGGRLVRQIGCLAAFAARYSARVIGCMQGNFGFYRLAIGASSAHLGPL